MEYKTLPKNYDIKLPKSGPFTIPTSEDFIQLHGIVLDAMMTAPFHLHILSFMVNILITRSLECGAVRLIHSLALRSRSQRTDVQMDLDLWELTLSLVHLSFWILTLVTSCLVGCQHFMRISLSINLLFDSKFTFLPARILLFPPESSSQNFFSLILYSLSTVQSQLTPFGLLIVD